jgi:hypothetical protein
MDRELGERIEAVGTALEGKVKRGWMTGQELDNLPHVLERGEHVVVVAAASKGIRAGILAVTDRRVLFLYLDELQVDLSRKDVLGAHPSPGGWSSTNRLVLKTRDDEETFSDIKPDERLPELVEALRGVPLRTGD